MKLKPKEYRAKVELQPTIKIGGEAELTITSNVDLYGIEKWNLELYLRSEDMPTADVAMENLESLVRAFASWCHEQNRATTTPTSTERKDDRKDYLMTTNEVREMERTI